VSQHTHMLLSIALPDIGGCLPHAAGPCGNHPGRNFLASHVPAFDRGSAQAALGGQQRHLQPLNVVSRSRNADPAQISWHHGVQVTSGPRLEHAARASAEYCQMALQEPAKKPSPTRILMCRPIAQGSATHPFLPRQTQIVEIRAIDPSHI